MFITFYKFYATAKKSFVEMDENDNGIRNILNFGHTVGHAIEALGKYKTYTHGQGVAIGMVAALKLFKPEKIGRAHV
jgi:3-dehydroquinate synthase